MTKKLSEIFNTTTYVESFESLDKQLGDAFGVALRTVDKLIDYRDKNRTNSGSPHLFASTEKVNEMRVLRGKIEEARQEISRVAPSRRRQPTTRPSQ